MYKNPLVSIAIPAYKQKYLAQAIQSLLNQTISNIEIIIVNDRSPEDITTVVNSFSDSRIRYYINEYNIGGKDPVANWNRCLSYAKGEFFAMLCDDDLYEPTFVEEMLKLASDFPMCNVFHARVQVVNKEGDVVDFFPSFPSLENTSDYIWHIAHRARKQTISEWMYRREYIQSVGGYEHVPIAWGADYLSIMKFAIHGGIASTTKFLVTFRRSGENISNTTDKNIDEKIEGTLVYADKMKKLVIDNSLDSNILFPCIEKIKRGELRATMSVCPITKFLAISFHRKRYGISIKQIIYSLINRMIFRYA